MESPYFVSFVGLSGVGKTTAIEAAKAKLADRDPIVFHQRKTGSASQAIDERLKTAGNLLSARGVLKLVTEASASVVQDHVIPTLGQGRAVIMDRGFHCAIAYHGAGHELGEAYVEATLAAAGIMSILPDRIFLLDAPVEIAQQRKAARTDTSARLYDGAPYEARLRMRLSYLRQAYDERRPEHNAFHVIDTAERDAGAVASEIGRVIASDLVRLQK